MKNEQYSDQIIYKVNSGQVSQKQYSQSLINDFLDEESVSQRAQNNSNAHVPTKKLINFNSNKMIVVNKPVMLSTIQRKTNNFFKIFRHKQLLQRFKRNLIRKSYNLSLQTDQIKKQIHSMYDDGRANQVYGHTAKSDIAEDHVFQRSQLIIWDIIGIIVNLLLFWLTPFLVSFGEVEYQSIFIQIITSYLAINIIINLNKGVIVQGELIQNRRLIIIQYFKGEGIYQVLSLICLVIQEYLFSDSRKYIFFVIQVITTYLNLHQYFQYMVESYYFRGNINNLIDLISLVVQVYFYTHFIACIFHFVAIQNQCGISWLIKYEIINENVAVRYNYAFYWASMTITTVGYGDITAQNHIEVISSSVIMLFSTCVFAYSMNQIGIILKNFYDQKLKYKYFLNNNRQLLLQINKHMKQNSVDYKIQDRVRNYLKFFTNSDNSDNDIRSILSMLPKSLSNEVTNDIQMRIVNSISFFRNCFSQECRAEISKILEFQKYTPGDIIQRQGDNMRNLYFVQEGEVIIYEENSQKMLGNRSKSQIFGINQFFTGNSATMSAQSKGFAVIYKIPRNKFEKILTYYPLDKERFHHLKDQVVFNNNYVFLDIKCQICQKYDHLEIKCPLIQYVPDMEQRMKKEDFHDVKNERQQYDRILSKINTLKYLSSIQASTKQYQDLVKNTEDQSNNIQDEQQDIYINVEQQIKQSNLSNEFGLSFNNNNNNNNNNNLEQKGVIVSEVFDQKSKYRKSVRELTQRMEIKSLTVLDDFNSELKISFLIDKICNQKKYMPQNNCNYILQHCKYKQQDLNEFQKYTFLHSSKLIMYKIRTKT